MDDDEIRLAALCVIGELPLKNKIDTLAVLSEIRWLIENYLFVERRPLDDGNS